MLKLSSDFINPRFLNKISVTNGLKGILKKSTSQTWGMNNDIYTVEVCADNGDCMQKLFVKESCTEIFEDMEIEVRLVDGFIVGFTKEECVKEKIEEAEKLKVSKKKESIEKERILMDDKKYKEECKKFYDNLSVGIEFTPVYKVVMSGLSESSVGDGFYRNTVTHLRVEEDLTDGKRFKRSSGEILCKPKGNGKKALWYEENIHTCLDGEEYMEKITCKSCLKILRNKGWIKE